jgi:hypothetical protein
MRTLGIGSREDSDGFSDRTKRVRPRSVGPARLASEQRLRCANAPYRAVAALPWPGAPGASGRLPLSDGCERLDGQLGDTRLGRSSTLWLDPLRDRPETLQNRQRQEPYGGRYGRLLPC